MYIKSFHLVAPALAIIQDIKISYFFTSRRSLDVMVGKYSNIYKSSSVTFYALALNVSRTITFKKCDVQKVGQVHGI